MAGDGASSDVAAAGVGGVAPAPGGDQPQQPVFTIYGFIKGLVVRAAIFYVIANFFRRPATGPTGSGDGATGVGSVGGGGMKPAMNLFQNGTLMDLYVYLSEDEVFTQFNDTSKLVWLQVCFDLS